jgi:RHH-type transcriptional regulator, proline utilization regulon repressor / proline dehydrogenase / delta 1-pyrroline-5-carboxylate dehydrogenase
MLAITNKKPELGAFSAPYAPPDEGLASTFLACLRDPAAEVRVNGRARRLVEVTRLRAGGLGGIDDFLHAYSLSTKEGLALMVLAEALLRVPDAATADRLIKDKLAGRDWSHPDGETILISASAWTLGVTGKLIAPGETPEGILDSVARRIGLSAVRLAARQAMKLLGTHFVLGQTIEEALDRASARREFRYSFDMLGEGARTAADADRYFESYTKAITAIGRHAECIKSPDRPGISVKLSALHPRFEATSRDRVLAELPPKLLTLAREAKRNNLRFTVDAEEADRLELSLDVIADVFRDPSLAGWDGFGFAVQAYQKRAPAVIDWAIDAARAMSQPLMIRLVKGAYWDTEIKRAQERGLDDFPVFTRKAMTDLCYMVCARKMLAARPLIVPQFATHNALTVASVIEAAGPGVSLEFQRLHGMGEALYDALRAEIPDHACRVYAPVGGHRDLLAYLVRRLLENGANTSFVSVAADPTVPVSEVLRLPQDEIGKPEDARNRRILRPRDLYAPLRVNSEGFEFGERKNLEKLIHDVHAASLCRVSAAPILDGIQLGGWPRPTLSPIDAERIGDVIEGDSTIAASAMMAAQSGFAPWNATALAVRVACLNRAAELLEQRRARFIGLLQAEGGKTLDDALSELREAVDYCRYYAATAQGTLLPEVLPGPTGETNELRYRGRGVFVCISPWNFPLAIFLGQVTAALVAGNAVVAKPAEQTPLIAYEAVRLLHEAGIPHAALQYVPGTGGVGAALVADRRCAGVAFTGSTQVGQVINRALAAKNGPIAPLIAETGGINAMIVDATALPEQVTDDVLTSSFRSAGQRCSALRLLCLQEEIADHVLDMIEGASRELELGDPRAISTHVGPVIDGEARDNLHRWIAEMESQGRIRFRWDSGRTLPSGGFFVPPVIVMLDRARDLKEEVFGPILHVMRWRGDELDSLLDDIAGNGTALTLGIHSRIDARTAKIAHRMSSGNVYVNRSMIGAVVGTQPFGGTGTSGTGPKAGGPNYLRRFASEQTVSVNTAAAGGNASLFTAED